MKALQPLSRAAFIATLSVAASLSLSAQEDAAPEEPLLVFRTGRSIPLSAVAQQGENFVVRQAVAGYAAGTVIPRNIITHVSGEKPPALSLGTGQLLTGHPAEAIKILEPLVTSLKPTAKISGNYWIDAARVLVLSYAQEKETTKAEPLIKEISEASPAPGIDPVGRLAKALATPVSAGFDARMAALDAQISDSNPTEISAFASFFKGRLMEEEKKTSGAIEAFLTVGCLYPSGAVLTTSAAELRAGLLLAAKPERRLEAVALIKSAAQGAANTPIAAEAQKRLASLADAPEKPADAASPQK